MAFDLSNLLPGQNPQGLSPQQITDLINHKTGVSRIDSTYRLLYYDPHSAQISPVFLPTAMPGQDPSDISSYVSSCKIEMQTTRDVHRSVDLEMYELPGIQFDPIKHLIQPFVTYYDPSGNVLLDVPMGIFSCNIPDRDISDALNLWKISGYDMTSWVSQIWFLNQSTYKAGTSYFDAIFDLLTMDYKPLSIGGRGKTPQGCDDVGPNVPLNRISIPIVGQTNGIPTTIPIDIIFTTNDNKLNAINSLLAAINYYPLWVDENGIFRSRPRPYWTEAVPEPTWTYNTDIHSIIIAPVSQTFPDQSEMANICEVYVESSGRLPIASIQYNNSPDSAISLDNLGRAVVKQIKDDSIPDYNTAYLRAIMELQFAATLNEQIQFNAIVNPFHKVHDYLIINIQQGGSWQYVGTGDQIHVEYLSDGPYAVSTTTYPFEELSWTLDMSTREMEHVVGRVVAI